MQTHSCLHVAILLYRWRTEATVGCLMHAGPLKERHLCCVTSVKGEGSAGVTLCDPQAHAGHLLCVADVLPGSWCTVYMLRT